MKVLLVGGGGREHAIAQALVKSPEVSALLCAPGNGGIEEIARCFPDVKATDLQGIERLVEEEKVDYVVIAPDDPLALGLADRLCERGIPAFGPKQQGARLESSKIYSKSLMRKYGIPTADFQVFSDADSAMDYLDRAGAPIVVKADGLALGKGVVVAGTTEEAKAAVRAMMLDRVFAGSGSRVVIEECLFGREVTVLCFTDGKTIVPMPASQDHKRALDGDMGPNTGGMGAFAPSPLYTPEIAEQVREKILMPSLKMLKGEGIDFRGVLYVGLMLTPKGPYVIEYNARFGDPETQAVLPLIETDLFSIFRAVSEGRLSEMEIVYKDKAAMCVVVASGGYPGKYQTGYPIRGMEDARALDAQVLHAGTRREGEAVLTAGGRVLGVVAVRDTLRKAAQDAYRAAEKIRFTDAHMRRDIGRADGLI